MIYRLGEMLCYLGYGWGAKLFCKKQLKETRLRGGIWIVIFCVGIGGIRLLCDQTGAPYLITAVLHHGFVSLLVLAGFRGGIGKKLLVSVVLLLIKELAGHFANSFFSCLALILFRLFQKEVTGISWELDWLIGYASYGAFLFFLWLVKEPLVSVFIGKPDRWYRMLSLPLLFLLVIIDVVNWGSSQGIMVVSYCGIDRLWGSYQNQLISHGAICLLTLLCLVLAGSILLGMNQIDTEQKRQQQYKLQTSFYGMLMEQYEKSERLRHDMKNHVLCLQGLYDEKNWEKMGDYLRQMQRAGDLGWEELTGNRAVDVLLCHKKRQAEKRDISWECEVSVLSKVKISEFDLCVILGNLLDNALAAAEEVPEKKMSFVQVQIQKVKKCLVLVVKNGTVLRDLCELKEGTGLSNVRTVVERYGGVIQQQLSFSVFAVSILLPEERPDMTKS